MNEAHISTKGKNYWKMMRMFILLSVLQVLSLNEAYNFSCPSQAHWNLRAKSKCNPPRNYTCLLNVTFGVKEYGDICSKPRILARGYKYVLQPNLNRANCRLTRYQPFSFHTIGHSDCAFQKSLCNGEGQITFENGRTTLDRTCLCDTAKGYTLLNIAKYKCYCNPSKEDCSCYIDRTKSSKDLKCYGEIIIPQNRLQEESLNQSQVSKINDFDNYKYNIQVPSSKFKLDNGKSILILIMETANENRTKPVRCVLISALLYCLAVGIYLLKRIKRQRIKTKLKVLSEKYARLIIDKELEKRYFVKVMILGKESAGKTSLLRRLLKEDFNKKEPSTDGVDIVVRRCKINIENGEWLIGKDLIDDKLERLTRAHNMKTGMLVQGTMETKDDNNKRKKITAEGTEKEKVTRTQSLEQDGFADSTRGIPKVRVKYAEDLGQNTNNSDEPNLHKLEGKPSDILYSLLSSIDFEKPIENCALCELWDFAGQKEFYVTHQVFLTSCAVYLLVADLADFVKQSSHKFFVDTNNVREYFNFWFDSIHCLRHEETQADTSKGYQLDPPVIIVCTGIDKYTTRKNLRELFSKQLSNVMEGNSKFRHYRDTLFVSNIDDSGDVFKKLRHDIFQTAKKLSNWGEEKPLHWILLEHFIEKTRSTNIVIVTYKEISQLSSKSEFGTISDLELNKFLKFQHNIGNIIFFKEIADYVILNPQWLADAFRCIVSDKIELKILNHPDLMILRQTGRISNELITEMFKSKSGTLFLEYKEHLLKVMEKFDIIVRPIETISETNRFYILPSILQSSTLTKVCELFKVYGNGCTRTSWLCIEFNFLPPAFFYHILVWFIRRYKISKVKDGEYKIHALYKGIGVFDLEGNGRTQLVVTVSKDTVAIQIWIWDPITEVTHDYINIREEFYSKIENLQQRYRLRLTYKRKMTCNDGNICTSSVEVEQLQKNEQYKCPEHAPHFSNDVLWPWFKMIAKVKKTTYDDSKFKPEQDKPNPRYINDDDLEHKIKVVEKHKTKLPENLQYDYFDAMVFYMESDRNVATEYCEKLKSLELKHPLKPILYDDSNLDYVTRSKYNQIRMICDHSMFIFVIVTEAFIKNRPLLKTVNQKENDEFYSFFDEIVSYCVTENKIIPVRTKQGLALPFGLGSMKSVDFFNQNDENIKGHKNLFAKSDDERREKEYQFIKKQFEYLISNMHIPNIV